MGSAGVCGNGLFGCVAGPFDVNSFLDRTESNLSCIHSTKFVVQNIPEIPLSDEATGKSHIMDLRQECFMRRVDLWLLGKMDTLCNL